MLSKLRPQNLSISRSFIIAAIPIFFLLLLALWTLLNIGVNPVKAQSTSISVFAVVKRSNANLREGPGTQYRVVGKSLSGATLPVIGKYVNDFGQRWYKVYLRALGEVWVSGTVVDISPTNADIPLVGITQVNTAVPLPTSGGVTFSGNNSGNSSNSNNNGNTGNTGNTSPPTNPPPQSTAVPQQPATTPDPNA